MKLILIVLIFILASLAFKYYISSLVLSAWIVEKNYAPPTDEDSQRLAKWVAQKMFSKR